MKKRITVALLCVPFAVVLVAGPAQAAPRDAQGCENQRSPILTGGYCG